MVDTSGGNIVVRDAPYLERGKLVLKTDEWTKVFQSNQKDEALKTMGALIGAENG